MKQILSTIIIFLISWNSYGQHFSQAQQDQIDSLNGVLNNPKSKVAVLASSTIILSEILSYQYIDTVIPMSEDAILLIEKGLQMNPNNADKNILFQAQIDALNNIGFVYSYHGDYKKSLHYFKASKKVIDKVDDIEAQGVYYINIGDLYKNQGEIIKAMKSYYRALKIYETLKNELEVGKCLFNIGIIYQQQENYSSALIYLLKSLELYEKNKAHYGIGNILTAIGDIYNYQEENDKAIKYYNRSLIIQENNGNLKGLATTYHNIGSAFRSKGELTKAMDVYLKGIAIRKKGSLTIGLASSYVTLSSLHYQMGNIDQANIYANKGIELSLKLGDPIVISKAAINLSRIEKDQGNFEKSLELFQLHIQMRDSIKNDSTLIAIVKKHEQYQFEKIEAKIKTDLILEKEKVKFRSYFLIGISFLLLITLVYALFVYRKKKKEEQFNLVLLATNETVLAQKEVLLKNVDELEKSLEGQKPDEEFYYFTQSAIKVMFKDVIFLESNDHYVMVHVAERKHPLIERIKMEDLVKDFPTTLFVKIHRSYTINMDHVVSRPSKFIVKMSNEKTLKASRGFVDNLGDKFR